MTTSSSSVIIILVLNIFFSTPSFVSSTETRNDDVTLPELLTLVQQQSAVLQTLQAKVTADESTAQQQAVTIQQQATLLQTLQAKLTADENTAHQQAALLQTIQAKVTADESTAHQQATLLQTMQTKMTTAENTIHSLQAQLSAVQARQDKNVAFTARFSGYNNVDLGQHGIIKFSPAITNIGGGYNTATGLFTAPVGGVYAFTLNIRSDKNHDFIVVEMTKDGNTHLCSVVVQGPEIFYDKSSCSAVVHLNVGEQVFARHYEGSTFLEEGHFTAFTGFLVHAD